MYIIGGPPELGGGGTTRANHEKGAGYGWAIDGDEGTRARGHR